MKAETLLGKTCKADPSHGRLKYASNNTCVECQKGYRIKATLKQRESDQSEVKIKTSDDPWHNPFKPKS